MAVVVPLMSSAAALLSLCAPCLLLFFLFVTILTESFFQRNIDLASRLMSVERSLSDSAQAKETLSTQAQRQSRDLERLQQRHADLSARAQSGGSSRDADARDAHGAKAKAELEQLEARCTVLRVHVQQLEQHYLNLQSAIHQAGAAGFAVPSGQESKEQQLMAGVPSPPPPHAAPTFRFDPARVSPAPFPQRPAAAAPLSGSQSARGAGNGAHPHAYAMQPYAYGYGYPPFGPATGLQFASPARHSGQMAQQQPRGQQSARLPAVAGAQPSPPQQTAYSHSPAYPPAPMLLATPQQPVLTFSPR